MQQALCLPVEKKQRTDPVPCRTRKPTVARCYQLKTGHALIEEDRGKAERCALVVCPGMQADPWALFKDCTWSENRQSLSARVKERKARCRYPICLARKRSQAILNFLKHTDRQDKGRGRVESGKRVMDE